jgi:hypothetical protein
MANNTMTPFGGNGRVPAALAGRTPSMTGAARAGVQASFSVLKYRGRAWSITYRGDTELLKDARGRPLTELEVIIVGVTPNVSKTYYAKNYAEGDDSPPDCWSLDGIAPDAVVPHKQNPVCGTCPKNQWGSRVTEQGRKAKACSDNRRVALVPEGDIPNERYGGPMLLRLPPTTLVNFANYGDLLERHGADFPWVKTKLSFDYDVAYPKLVFEAIGYISEEQVAQVEDVMRNPLIGRMLTEASPTASAPEAAGAANPLAGGPPARVVQLPRAATPAPATQVEEEYEEETEEAPAAPPVQRPVEATSAPVPRGRRRPAAAPAPASVDLEGAIDALLDGDA